jgi:cytochrome P450
MEMRSRIVVTVQGNAVEACHEASSARSLSHQNGALMYRPSPPGQSLLGHFRPFRRDPLRYLHMCARDFGDAVPLRFATRHVVLVSDPRLIAEVLVTKHRSFRKHFALRMARPALGDGLLTSEGQPWLQHRQIMQPAFRGERIAAYARIMSDHAQSLVSGWRDGQAIDAHRQMMGVTARIVTQCLFGTDLGGDSGDIHAAMDVLTDSFKSRLDSPIRLPLYLPTPGNLRFRRGLRRIDAVLGRIITHHRSGGSQADLLGALLSAVGPDGSPALTDRELRDEVATLFVAGHETTANALTWTLWLLATHPEIQVRLEQEIDGVCTGRHPTSADVPRLTFCGQVIEESMRLMPPAWIIGREALAAVMVGDVPIARGTTVLMSQWVVHRDPRWFIQPDEFRPDRWAGGLADRLPDFAYFPFGGGPRSCIGAGFARLEMILLLATMVCRHRLTLADGAHVEPVATITLRPRFGMPMVVHERPLAAAVATRPVPLAGDPVRSSV